MRFGGLGERFVDRASRILLHSRGALIATLTDAPRGGDEFPVGTAWIVPLSVPAERTRRPYTWSP